MTYRPNSIASVASAPAPQPRPLPPIGLPAEVVDPGLVRIGAAVGTRPHG